MINGARRQDPGFPRATLCLLREMKACSTPCLPKAAGEMDYFLVRHCHGKSFSYCIYLHSSAESQRLDKDKNQTCTSSCSPFP